MLDLGVWKPASYQAAHSFPGDSGLLTPAPERPGPKPAYLEAEGIHGPGVGGHSIVVIVTPQHRSQPSPHHGDRSVKEPPKLALDFLELRPKSLPHGMAKHHELAVLALTADMSKAEKIK